MHGSQLRVAYQGVPDPNSEATAEKAYPNCEAIPCDQFEVAFQAVELWIANRAVLPIENSAARFTETMTSLLALPGVRKEYLTRVISHPQALAQCELTLTKLGLNVVREEVDDTEGVAEFVAANNLCDSQRTRRGSPQDEHLADEIQDDSSNETRFVMLT
ncbi:hypothetical protein SO802_033585 [Lithocarpus litseifolius]|uniref:Prephenate dehydratase domain-containing protein n=1 Tax=Lithocarpus litseifolius TaxID=425828 RepID=A0AAW2BIW3_9ROSI